MKLARRYNTLACLTTLLAALSYCAAEDDTVILSFLSIIACLIAWYAGRGHRPWALPRWLINLLMIAAIIDASLKVLSARSYSAGWAGSASAPIVSTLSEFLIYILLAKLFDRRTARDEAHVLSLGIFVVVGAVLTSNSLIVGLLVLLFAPCVVCAAMLLQLVGGARAVDDWAIESKLGPEPPQELPPAAARRFRRDFILASFLAIGSTLSLATVVFIVLPRGLWKDILGGFGRVEQGAVVGFTDQARLGQEGLLKNQDVHTPVLNVRLTTTINNKEENLGELRGTLYLRGAVKTYYRRDRASWEYDPPRLPRFVHDSDLSEITGGLTDLGNNQRGFEVTSDVGLRLGNPARGQIIVRQEITVLRPTRANPYFFTIWRPLSLHTAQPSTVFFPGRELVLRAARPLGSLETGGVNRYTIISAMEYSDPREPERRNVSFDSPIVQAIAEQVLTEKGVPIDPKQRDAAANRRAALAFMDYLRAECAYDREMIAPLPGEDPIDMFLTRTKRGHCEYFASAMVAMCHSVGLDARYIAGYLATEFNRVKGEYVVRESNAHAWAEVRIGPGRWQTFDPSPPAAIEEIHRRPMGVMARVRQWYEALNFTWTSSVVFFDGSKQQRIINAPEGWIGRTVLRVSNFLSGLRRLPIEMTGGLRLALVLVIAAAIIVVLQRTVRSGARRARRRRAIEAAGAADESLLELLAQAEFYHDALDLLDRSDLAKPQHRPPVLHAQKIDAGHPQAAAAFAKLADLYYRIRFGRRPLSDTELAGAREALDALRAQLHRPNEATQRE